MLEWAVSWPKAMIVLVVYGIAALPSILESIVCTNECFLQLLFQKPRELNNNRS